MTLPPWRIGDKGQRYAVVFKGFHEDDPEKEHTLAFSDNKAAMDDLVEQMAGAKHPVWRDYRVVDRGNVLTRKPATVATAPATGGPLWHCELCDVPDTEECKCCTLSGEPHAAKGT